ncbi:MAG: PDZ domain-containing protein [Tepidisphaerales bacterium]
MHTAPLRRLLSCPLALALAAAVLTSASATPAASANPVREIYDRVSPSVVVVQYVWANEARRQEITAVGLVVGEGGLVMTPLITFAPAIPDEQMQDFKIVLPRVDTDHEELDAVFLGRDERNQVAFIRLKEPRDLPVIRFLDRPLEVGEPVLSIGLLPKDAGYKTYVNVASIAARVRGETSAFLVSGPLANVGAVVLNMAGEAVGLVIPQGEAPFFLFDPRLGQTGPNTRFFIPSFEFLPAFSDLPTPGQPQRLPFTGIFGMSGLSRDLAEVFGLVGQPAVEIGDVIPDSPAAKAGLEKGMIIVGFEGQPLTRGDQPEELGMILGRQILRRQVGETVRFSVIRKRGDSPVEVPVTLAERPPQPNTAKRFFAEDLGYTVRDAVFIDLYRQRLPQTTRGVVVDFIKPNSQAATARLERGDLVTQMNGNPVASVDDFRSQYETFRRDRPRDAIVLQVQRPAGTQIIRIEPPQ